MIYSREEYEEKCNHAFRNFTRGFITIFQLEQCLEQIWKEWEEFCSLSHDDFYAYKAELGEKITY